MEPDVEGVEVVVEPVEELASAEDMAEALFLALQALERMTAERDRMALEWHRTAQDMLHGRRLAWRLLGLCRGRLGHFFEPEAVAELRAWVRGGDGGRPLAEVPRN